MLYTQSLGADAAPALTSYLVSQPLTPPGEWVTPTEAGNPRRETASDRDGYTARCYAARQLLDSWGPKAERDWRGWTLGKARARRAVAANVGALNTLAGITTPPAKSVPCAQPDSH